MNIYIVLLINQNLNFPTSMLALFLDPEKPILAKQQFKQLSFVLYN